MQHDLARHFRDLARFESTAALAASPLWRRIQGEVEHVLGSVVREDLAVSPDAAPDRVRVTAWNLERGTRFEGIRHALAEHRVLRDSDILLLTELDHGMARSGNRAVARDLAKALGLNYAFAPCYLSLSKGSGLEARAEGENAESLHGNAVFARWPIRDAWSVALPNGKDKMKGSEKRLGRQRAVVAAIDHPSGPLVAASVHLDCHSSRRHRRLQMRLLLDAIDARGEGLPAVVGGDWNTSGYNAGTAWRAILGYWRRVLMGVENVVTNHYPHPERYFERELFADLERRGYRYRDVNAEGACTYRYDAADPSVNTNLGDWIPGWCFPFIRWAMARVGGSCGLKLDWFAVRGLAPSPESIPTVVTDVNPPDGPPLSDHLPITVDLVPARTGD